MLVKCLIKALTVIFNRIVKCKMNSHAQKKRLFGKKHYLDSTIQYRIFNSRNSSFFMNIKSP